MQITFLLLFFFSFWKCSQFVIRKMLDNSELLSVDNQLDEWVNHHFSTKNWTCFDNHFSLRHRTQRNPTCSKIWRKNQNNFECNEPDKYESELSQSLPFQLNWIITINGCNLKFDDLICVEKFFFFFFFSLYDHVNTSFKRMINASFIQTVWDRFINDIFQEDEVNSHNFSH